MHGHGTKKHGLVTELGRRGWLDLMILNAFSNLNDYVTIFFECTSLQACLNVWKNQGIWKKRESNSK